MEFVRWHMSQGWRPRTASGAWWRRIEATSFALGWLAMVLFAWAALSRQFGLTGPTSITVVLQGLTPFIPVVLGLMLAALFLRRRVVQGLVASMLMAVNLASVAPALGSRSRPGWTVSAPQVRVLSANVYDHNPVPTRAARFLVNQDADVLILVEVSRPMREALKDAGVDHRYPFHQTGRLGTGTTSSETIYSRRPLIDATSVPVGAQAFPAASVAVGPARLRLIGVHVQDPLRGRDEWSSELRDLRTTVGHEPRPLVLAGDFNANRWNPGFGDLLGAGLHDASESSGGGLTLSWPVHRLMPTPVIRLDHAVATVGAEAVRVRDVDVPGSDHRALDVTWSVDPR